jgi:choline dehydrogenase
MSSSSSRFDVAVLGGGAAGCVLAARLSEEPDRRVCLVEAGPDYGPYSEGRWPAEILDGRRLALESHTWETAVEDRSQLRAKIMGGCSAHNACVVLAGADADYDEWGPGWTADELRPYLERGARELRTRSVPDEEVSPWGRAWVDAGGGDAIVNPLNAVGQVRWNTSFAYLDPARDRPNLNVRANTLVDRIDPDPGTVHTDQGDLRAERIVLAAGAYGSPAILLRSGIGPGLAHDLPVGQGLCDHVGTGLGWDATETLQRDVDEFAQNAPVFMGQVTVRGRTENCPEGISDLFLFPAIEAGESGWEISAAVFVMKPYSRGEVRLLSDDPAAPLDIRHNWLADERDALALTEGFELLRELAASEPVRRYAARELRPGPGVDAASHVRETARGFFHPTGTCAIGRVVDAEARVLGIPNVRVADASIMPTIPTANTHLSTVAIAERVAELL